MLTRSHSPANPRRAALVGVAATMLLVVVACGNRHSTSDLLRVQSVAASAGDAGPGVASQATGGGTSATTTPGASASGGALPVAGASPVGAGGSTGAGSAASGVGGTKAGGTAPSTGTAASPAACTQPGAPLVVGQVGAWSGLVGQSAGNGRTGLAVWAQDVNARGGIACHPVQLYSVDDQSSGDKSAAAVNDLVQNKKAQAIVGSFVPIDGAAYKSAVESNKVPTIGGDVTGPNWYDSPYMFAVGGAPEAVYTATMKGATTLGKTKLALWYCVESSSCSYGEAFAKKNAPKVGASVVYETTISLTQSDFTSQCQNSKSAGATAVFYFGDGSSVQRLARSCNNLGYNPTIMVPSLAAIAPLRTDPNTNKDGMVFGPSVFPWMLGDNPARKAFQDAYARYAPGAPTDAAAATAWTDGKMLEAAVTKLGQTAVGQPITTAMIMEGLGMIQGETLGGLIPPTTFSPHQAATPAVGCAYVTTLENQQWHPQNNGQLYCL